MNFHFIRQNTSVWLTNTYTQKLHHRFYILSYLVWYPFSSYSNWYTSSQMTLDYRPFFIFKSSASILNLAVELYSGKYLVIVWFISKRNTWVYPFLYLSIVIQTPQQHLVVYFISLPFCLLFHYWKYIEFTQNLVNIV